jgi:hypothetical protein
MDLTPDEVAVLEEALASEVSDLRMEVAGTDAMEFREELKRKEALLRSILERLRALA